MIAKGNVMVGLPAPDFRCSAVVDGRLKEVSLSAYTSANHWLVLVFFPKAWSFICPTEIRAFSSRLEEFLYNRQCAVVFASTDSELCLKAWNATSEMEGGLGGVHVPLIGDCSQKMCRDYGVLDEGQGVAQRALFIIDPKGTVRSITVNDADVGRSVDETQRILDALIFKDEFGEGCPVDWKRGDEGIKMKQFTNIEGPVEVPLASFSKTIAEWARPKLQRAWSGASSRSVQSVTVMPTITSPPGATVVSTGLHSHSSSLSTNYITSGIPPSQGLQSSPRTYPGSEGDHDGITKTGKSSESQLPPRALDTTI
ncbi:thioredoxin-like protein [Polychaeton citri CBS 116435]|uniref:Thioredoxin-like protein n=1 Tax=Polychaeton citri CBS 116435 TaxID=1314669 RepID=A0A9P4QAX6_9PEZI|nr:thioredoxin-like protein [Polychaeton citri CBS 116435]